MGGIMSSALRKLPWKDGYIAAVQALDFGPEPWGKEVEVWIKELVIVERAKDPTLEVWLYATEDDGLVGFASLGKALWRWPDASGRPVPLSHIPELGVHSRFWGQPSEPGSKKFADQILDDLIFEALRHSDRRRLLSLYVHPDNRRAVRLYEGRGFERFFRTWADPETGVTYLSMLLDLTRRAAPE